LETLIDLLIRVLVNNSLEVGGVLFSKVSPIVLWSFKEVTYIVIYLNK